MKLYSFWRSSSSWRVRIALHHKQLDFEYAAVDLNPARKAHLNPAYAELNPQCQVPLLEVPGPRGPAYLTQSLPIIEYLEEAHPDPKLLPRTIWDRAQARRIAEVINSGTQPLQNAGVLEVLSSTGLGAEQVSDWARFWIARGLSAVERVVVTTSSHGEYCVGSELSIADLYLVPQMYNARRFGVAVEPFEHLCNIDANCSALDAFVRAHPDVQPDAPRPDRRSPTGGLP